MAGKGIRQKGGDAGGGGGVVVVVMLAVASRADTSNSHFMTGSGCLNNLSLVQLFHRQGRLHNSAEELTDSGWGPGRVHVGLLVLVVHLCLLAAHLGQGDVTGAVCHSGTARFAAPGTGCRCPASFSRVSNVYRSQIRT